MLGKCRILFTTGRCCYDFEIKRKYTILAGDSATGKSEFIEGVKNRLERMDGNVNEDLFSTLSCDLKVVVFDRNMYKSNGFKSISKGNLLVLIDERDIDKLIRDNTLKCLADYDNYYIIASRDLLRMSPLDIDIDDICEIKTSESKVNINNEFLFKSELVQNCYEAF